MVSRSCLGFGCAMPVVPLSPILTAVPQDAILVYDGPADEQMKKARRELAIFTRFGRVTRQPSRNLTTRLLRACPLENAKLGGASRGDPWRGHCKWKSSFKKAMALETSVRKMKPGASSWSRYSASLILLGFRRFGCGRCGIPPSPPY